MSTKIIAMEVDAFRKWVVEGLGSFKINGNRKGEPTQDHFDTCVIALPAKYEHLVKIEQPILLLVDELEWISLPTPEATQQMEAQFRNLGEGWLPFEHHPEIDYSQVSWLMDASEVHLEEELRDGTVTTSDLTFPSDQLTTMEADRTDTSKKTGRSSKKHPAESAEAKKKSIKEETGQLSLLDQEEIQ